MIDMIKKKAEPLSIERRRLEPPPDRVELKTTLTRWVLSYGKKNKPDPRGHS